MSGGEATAHSSEEDGLSPPRPFFLAGSLTDHGADHSDSDSSNNSPRTSVIVPRKQRNHHRRRSALGASQFSADSGDGARPPPSAFAFPFQAYPGNPDPIPGRISRRRSIESVRMISRSAATNGGPRFPRRPDSDALPHPKPPFHSPYRSSTGSVSSSTLYRSSAAAALAEGAGAQLPRASSATTIFRSPFLSPASRPDSLWTPPNRPFSRTGSASHLPLPPLPAQKKTMQSTRLKEKLTPQDKPWLARKKSSLERASKWITFGGIMLGLVIAAFIAFRGYTTVRMLTPNQLCLVLDEEFDSGSLDSGTWTVDVELGGYGNGEFEMTTNSPNNVYISNGQLYIMPTLTSDSISGGYSAVMDGATYTLDGCTASGGTTDMGAWVQPSIADFILQKRQNTGGGGGGGTGNGNGGTGGNGTAGGNSTGGGYNSTTGGNSTNSTSSGNTTSSGPTANPCTAISSSLAGTVINPVMSGRINTRGKKNIKYGKVEVKAKLPQGDWLWPAIWMLPESNATANGTQAEGTGVYGAWPVSGEIDIMEARGNSPSYPAQGSNYVRSSLNYGPFASGTTPIATTSGSTTANLMNSIYGWISSKRTSYASSFHVYAMEWTDSWMRFYTDNRLEAMIDISSISSKSTDSYFWNVAKFPTVAMNMSSGKYIVVEDPWSSINGGSAAAPFDQQFYLVVDLAAGGTSGWFPDNVGSKPWLDGSEDAMRAFASAQDTWSATWPSSADDRAFRIDYVKMWQLC
ncbi:glycoside hydrolase family 16 protein [Scleroderma yunnanense]